MFVHFTVWSEIGSVVRSRTVGVCVNMGQRLITSYEGHASLRQDAYLSGCVTGRVGLLYPGVIRIHVPQFWPPFWHSGDWTRILGVLFLAQQHQNDHFGVLKLPILTEFDIFGPKFHFSLNLLVSNFQRPAAHPRGHTSIGFRTEKLMIKEYFACNFD